jgi:hypothetical protein
MRTVRLPVAATIAALAAITMLSACGTGSPSHAGSPSPSSGSSANESSIQVHTESLAFARCMRADGVPNFPDPPGERKLPQPPTPTASQLVKMRAMMVIWAKCMRSHGLPHFGDPTITADGQRIMHGQFSIGSAAYYAARRACDPPLNRSMATFAQDASRG